MLLDLQKQILFFFTEHQTPFFNKIMEFFTLFGEELIPLAIGLFLFWCVDKKKGFVSAMVLIVANFAMNLLKCLIRFPRPWVLDPRLNTLRQSTATGYSFPSGHSTCASCFYSVLALQLKKKWLSIVCVILIVMVPFSRLYLCCHWPMDVVGGLVLGLLITFSLAKHIEKIFDDREKCLKVMPWIGLVVFVSGLVIAILLQVGAVDFEAFSDFSKAIAMCAGMFICYPIELKYFGFSVDGTVKQKTLRFAVGMIGAMFFMVGIKALLPYIPLISFFRYFLVAAWACLYPLIGREIKLFQKKPNLRLPG